MSYAEVVLFDDPSVFIDEILRNPEEVRRGIVRWQIKQVNEDEDNPYYEVFIQLTTVVDHVDGGCSLLDCTYHCGDRSEGDAAANEIRERLDDVAVNASLHSRQGKIEIP